MVKKNIKKKKFSKAYIFYGILIVLGIALALFFIQGITSSKNKISGMVVFDSYTNETTCAIAGHTWKNLINESCITLPDCIECSEDCLTEGEICETDCITEYTETLCELGCQETCDGNETECVVCEENCVKEYTEILCESNCILEENFCEEGCQETCENCSEVIVRGECIGDIVEEEEILEEENEENIEEEIIPDEVLKVEQNIILNETKEMNEEIKDDLTDEERKVLIEKFGDVAVKITKAELVNERIVIRYELGDYWFEPSYDSDISEKNLELQMEYERIKWLKDIANTLSQKEIDSEKIGEFLGDYII